MIRLWQWLRSEVGNTATEYAVIIALVGAALFLGGQSVQSVADFTFRKTATALGDAPDSAALVAIARANDVSSAGDLVASTSVAVFPLLQAAAWLVLLVAVGALGYSRYRQSRLKQQLEQLHCGPEPVAEEPGNPNFQKRQELQRVLLRHFDDVLHSRIEVRHIMSRRVYTVPQSMPVGDLRELMEREGFHHLLVANKGVLLGVISDRDVKGRRGWLARHVMTASPLTVTPTTQVSHAISMLLHRRISCLPVVEQGQIRGILTVTDMLMTLQCLMKMLERSVAEETSSPAANQPPTVATAGQPAVAC